MANSTAGKLAALPLQRPQCSTLFRSLRPGLTVALLLVISLALLRCILINAPLGHDESVYALGARSLLGDGPTSGWNTYRPWGMQLVAATGYVWSSSEWVLRILPVLLACFFFFAIYRVGREVVGHWSAWTACALLASSQHLLRRGSELLSDFGSSALLAFVTGIMLLEFRRENGPTWRLTLVAPIAATAFYLRYGASLPLACIAAAALVTWHRPILCNARLVLATGAFFALLLAPHLIWSEQETGSYVGVLRMAGKIAGRDYAGQGLEHYLQLLLGHGLGWPLTIAVVVGIGSGAYGLVRRKSDGSTSFIFLVATFHLISVGLLSHGEARYILFPIALFSLLGGRCLVEALPAKYERCTRAGALFLLTGYLLHSSHVSARRLERLKQARQVLVASGEWLREDAGGRECIVFTSYVPQTSWYSGCFAAPISSRAFGAHATDLRTRYLVVYDEGKRQPSAEKLREWGINTIRVSAQIAAASSKIGNATVYTLPY